jgi:hypothetical protein
MTILASLEVGIRQVDLRNAIQVPAEQLRNIVYYLRANGVWSGGEGFRGSGPGLMHYYWLEDLMAKKEEGVVGFICDVLVGSGDLVRESDGDEVTYRVRMLGDYFDGSPEWKTNIPWRDVVDPPGRKAQEHQPSEPEPKPAVPLCQGKLAVIEREGEGWRATCTCGKFRTDPERSEAILGLRDHPLRQRS